MAKTYKIIFLFSIVSFFLLIPIGANAATLSFSPLSVSSTPGGTFSVNVIVSSTDQSINAASGTVSFPWDKLEVVSVSKQGSIFSLWAEEPSFSNSAGTVSFEGVVLNPGFKGANGKILSINFRSKLEGDANLSFASGSVLANDGSGTNVLSDLKVSVVHIESSGSATIPASLSFESEEGGPVISSSTHPNNSLWYANNDPEFSWVLPKGALRTRTILSKSSNATPAIVQNPAVTTRRVENLSDGTYYFALQVETASGWGKIGRYKINIDTQPPKPFTITFPHGNSSLEPQPVILFNTEDGESGISHYDIKIGDGGPERQAPKADSNPYPLPPQKPGSYLVKVIAFDRAGNTTEDIEEFTIEAIDTPEVTYFTPEIETGDIARIRGRTYENADVTVYVREGKDIIAEENVRSNSLGDFSTIITKRLSPGTYTFTVFVTDSRGASSEETEPLEFRVDFRFFKDLSNLFVDYLARATTILLVLFGAGSLGFYFYSRTLKKIRNLRQQEKQIVNITSRSFELLRKDIEKQIARLHKAKTKRNLTADEIQFLEEFKENMKDAQDTISKEVKEIS